MKFVSVTLSAMLLMCIGTRVIAQEKSLSQQQAEADALKKYEAVHTPLPSIPPPAPGENEALFGAHLVRSATLLEMSCKERRVPVRIIIYGQSITGSALFTEDMRDYLVKKFPYADITLENRCIGGFTAPQIIRTAVHDLYYARPDLIIFHVYGGEKTGELEQLFSNIRKYTTADLLLMSHALNASQKEMNEFSAKYMRYIANKYDFELADISYEWPKYLTSNNLAPTDLLRDGVHPNRNGNWLLVQLVGRHIQYNPLFPAPSYNTVQNCYIGAAYDDSPSSPVTFTGKPWERKNGIAMGQTTDSKLKLTFTGTRVDVVAGQVNKMDKTGSARILLDGKPIETNPSLYAINRPSPGPGTWWPLVRRVTYNKPLLLEDWTLHIDKINADSTEYTFSVKGSKTGNDGTGSNKRSFVSNSGRVVIDSVDFMFIPIKKTFKVQVPVGFEAHWSVYPLYERTYHPAVAMPTERNRVYKTTLVQGLENTSHTLEIVPLGDGPVPIESFEIHRPSSN